MFYTLEAMRGAAAFLIVDRHVGWLGTYDFPISGLAVDLFFLLSGAVLAHSYEDKLRTGKLSSGRYIGLRLIRLYPLYALFTLVGFANHAAAGPLTGADFAKLGSSLLFLPCIWIDGSVFPFDGPAWSIFFELLISVVYGVALHDKSIKTLACVCGAAATLFIVQAINQPGALDIAMTCQGVFETGLARVLFSFTYGVIIYRLAMRASARESGLMALIPLVAVCAMLMAPVESRWITNGSIAVTLLAGLPACLFMALVFPAPDSWRGPFRRLGAISYAVYIGHVPLYHAADIVLKRQFHIDAMAFAPYSGFIFVAALAVLAYGLHNAWDAPLRARLRNSAAAESPSRARGSREGIPVQSMP